MKAIDAVKIEDIKIVYFDIDGVLSIPRYPFGKNKAIVPFGSDDKWKPFIKDNANGYDQCYASTEIKNWIKKLRAKGVIVKSLSAGDDSEIPAKKAFIEKNYTDLVDEMLFVPSSHDKAAKMEEERLKYGFDAFEMVLVEDHHNTLIEIADHGFRGIHTAWFLDAYVESTDKKDTYEHAYVIEFASTFLKKYGILISADEMDHDTAKYIMQQHHPVLARLFRVRYLMMG
jgi:hypothetical protein